MHGRGEGGEGGEDAGGAGRGGAGRGGAGNGAAFLQNVQARHLQYSHTTEAFSGEQKLPELLPCTAPQASNEKSPVLFERQGSLLPCFPVCSRVSRRVSRTAIPLAGDGMVYGEFDLAFLARLLEAAEPQKGDTFVDLGSGCGRASSWSTLTCARRRAPRAPPRRRARPACASCLTC